MSPMGLFVSLFIFLATVDAHRLNVNGSEMDMAPLIHPRKFEELAANESIRRRLGTFQLCALCTCCHKLKGFCLPYPCCYGIKCNIPNKPFGFCSFSPKFCGCLKCQS